ncbi:MAG: hypothetical protein CMJ74_09440 [Planctomycetaceae bacterium]|nr:hypothetical protein [Planctomycetaceae bacterium]
MRFLPALAGMVYAHKDDNLYVNLFMPGTGSIPLPSGEVRITQATRYPLDAKVNLTIENTKSVPFTLRLRIPGWARGECVPGNLYRYLTPKKTANASAQTVKLSVNGTTVPLKIVSGYASISRNWNDGDQVQLKIAMPMRRVIASEKVVADRGRVAIERGPLVYCLEEIDNEVPIDKAILPDDTALSRRFDPDLLGGVMVIEGQGKYAVYEESAGWQQRNAKLRLIPYYAWNHRGNGKMEVWIPRQIETIEAANKAKEKASAGS